MRWETYFDSVPPAFEVTMKTQAQTAADIIAERYAKSGYAQIAAQVAKEMADLLDVVRQIEPDETGRGDRGVPEKQL